MNLIDLLQMTKPQAAQQQSEGLGPIMQFLAQNKAPQMPAIQMPQGSKYGQQILAHGLQKQDREDTYAAHLQAKNDMEQQQAQSIVGHEAELSDDPQTLELLRSGNAQLVAQGIERANEEYQLKKKAEYNESPTYQKWLNASPEEKAQLEQYLRLKTPATNIYTDSMKPPVGYRWNGDDHTSVLPLIGGPEDKAAQPLTESQAKAMSNLKVMEETSRQYDEFMARTGFDPTKMTAKDSMAQGLMTIDSPIADAFGLTPSIEHQGRRMASPEALEYFTTIGRWNEIFGRDKSGGAIKNPEYRAWLMQYWPGPNDTPEIVANKTKARKAYEQSLMLTANPETRQQAAVGSPISQVIDAKPGYNVVQTPEGDIVKQEGQRAWRNNNPGNIEYGPFAANNGAIGSDGRFAIFPSQEHGTNAQSDLLFNSAAYRNLPLSKAIAKYAPDFENNTPAYQKAILNAVGGADKLMRDFSESERNAILGAMRIVEGNKQGKTTVLKPSEHPLAKQAIDVKKNSPVEKAKKEARIKELRKQAGLQ